MRFEHEGLCLWYGEPDTPAPSEVVAAGTEVTLTLGVQPADASNRVGVLYRTNGGPAETVTSKFLWSDPSGKTQYYRAQLPAFRTGDKVEYVPVCRCAGRQVPAPENVPRSVSSFRVVGAQVESTPAVAPEESSLAEPGVASDPRRDLSTGSNLATLKKPAFINTGVHYDRSRVYRLIGRDLYSASTDESLEKQEYTVEKTGVVGADSARLAWQVVVRDGEVGLAEAVKP